MRTSIVVSLLASTLLAGPSIAQTAVGTSGATTRASGGHQFITQEQQGAWRASKLRGLNVYNQNNEKVGDIDDVLVDQQGRPQAVVIGVGGFLGMGEHLVALPFSELKWAMDAPRGNTASTAAPNTGAAAPTGSAANTGTNRTTSGDTNRTYPDHAILANATKDELKNAPQFRYRDSR